MPANPSRKNPPDRVPWLLDDYLTVDELIQQIGITFETLKRWNRLAIGPPFTMVGRHRLYHRDSAKAWLRSREQTSSVDVAE